MELNLSWVTPVLAVGGRFHPSDVPRLARELGVSRVVDVRLEDRDDEEVLRTHGVVLLHLPTVDQCAVSQAMLDDGVAWVTQALADGARVLIHCEHGIGRSALLALCVLVRMGDGPLEALERAKSARNQVSPSPEQLTALLTWCERWRPRLGAAWSVPTLEALETIAYRHLRSA